MVLGVGEIPAAGAAVEVVVDQELVGVGVDVVHEELCCFGDAIFELDIDLIMHQDLINKRRNPEHQL